MHSEKNVRTVRELAGEIWAETKYLEGYDLNWKMIESVLDVVMGVLARHEGKLIVNDADLPVTPLPMKYRDD
jgi:hypothetical protein